MQQIRWTVTRRRSGPASPSNGPLMTDTDRQLDAFLTYLLDGRTARRGKRP